MSGWPWVRARAGSGQQQGEGGHRAARDAARARPHSFSHPLLIAELSGEMQQRRAPLGDAVDVDDRLLEKHLEHAQVAILQRALEGGAVGGVAQVQRRARVQEELDDALLPRLGADDERRLPLAVLHDDRRTRARPGVDGGGPDPAGVGEAGMGLQGSFGGAGKIQRGGCGSVSARSTRRGRGLQRVSPAPIARPCGARAAAQWTRGGG